MFKKRQIFYISIRKWPHFGNVCLYLQSNRVLFRAGLPCDWQVSTPSFSRLSTLTLSALAVTFLVAIFLFPVWGCAELHPLATPKYKTKPRSAVACSLIGVKLSSLLNRAVRWSHLTSYIYILMYNVLFSPLFCIQEWSSRSTDSL